MIVIDNTIISEEIRNEQFCCNPEICKGACCIEGDAGAPLEEEEISMLEDDIDYIKPFMRKEGVEVIEKAGVFDFDITGEYVTPLINDRDCAFVIYEDTIAKCAIEKAWEQGKTTFRKPISCHLYPIRITRHKTFDALNYHRWPICKSACNHGKSINLTLEKYLKEPLIRKYGEDWYNKFLESK